MKVETVKGDGKASVILYDDRRKPLNPIMSIGYVTTPDEVVIRFRSQRPQKQLVTILSDVSKIMEIFSKEIRDDTVLEVFKRFSVIFSGLITKFNFDKLLSHHPLILEYHVSTHDMKNYFVIRDLITGLSFRSSKKHSSTGEDVMKIIYDMLHMYSMRLRTQSI